MKTFITLLLLFFVLTAVSMAEEKSAMQSKTSKEEELPSELKNILGKTNECPRLDKHKHWTKITYELGIDREVNNGYSYSTTWTQDPADPPDPQHPIQQQVKITMKLPLRPYDESDDYLQTTQLCDLNWKIEKHLEKCIPDNPKEPKCTKTEPEKKHWNYSAATAEPEGYKLRWTTTKKSASMIVPPKPFVEDKKAAVSQADVDNLGAYINSVLDEKILQKP